MMPILWPLSIFALAVQIGVSTSDFLGGKLARDFEYHQHGDFFQQFPEFLGPGVLIAHNGQLVLDERMIENMNFTQGVSPFSTRQMVRAPHPTLVYSILNRNPWQAGNRSRVFFRPISSMRWIAGISTGFSP